ncbi:30S ribosomal protein S20 [Candidatus Peribacteria bacterium]|nr:30S ribosomal protein S20 [Candidatus Peribacteria bacterium]
MPILDSSIKAARQNTVRAARRLPFKTSMKTQMRKVRDLAREGKIEEALKVLPIAFKAIDMAAKKKIIHPKNAANKKSLLSRLTNVRK